ncbi:golgin subfamily A member 6-like protein 10 [Lethenteron reissneri]|uniref:golgin subfamily A member 6-like protein 10 n=1 Tax=Lethenteron reissneri TaxID=7753 RepID=UPI002AB75D55|nr:golgin subfamily A member 6-like protein 10 [Lethenteron reissneri]
MTTPPTTPTSWDARYSRLRKRLDQLGYDQHLGRESLSLAETLFRDLVRTTEALGAERLAARRAEEQLQREREETVRLKEELERCREETERLVEERERLVEEREREAEDTERCRVERERCREERERLSEERERESERKRQDDEVVEEMEREMNVRRATSDRRHKVGSLGDSGGSDAARVATLLESTCTRIRDLQGELQRLRAELRRSEGRAADLDSQVRFLTVAKEEASSRCEADLRQRTAELRRSEACARQQAEKLAAHVETLKGELLESQEQRETLRLRMQDFVTEISHVEGMLGVREEEHSHLLACYGDATFPDSLLTNV